MYATIPPAAGKTTIIVNGLETGAYNIYIAAKDKSGNISETLKMAIPAYTAPEPEPEPHVFIINPEDPEAPSVIVILDPSKVIIDVPSGRETVRVPDGALTDAIEQAKKVALEAGENVEPTVEIKVEPVPGIDTVAVKIPVLDLDTVADSEVNVKIATAVGVVTLNPDAAKDLAELAASQGAKDAEIVLENKGTLDLEDDDSLTDAQKEVLAGIAETTLRRVYDISVVADDGTKLDFETEGKLTIGLPYPLQSESGETDDGVWVIHVAENGDTERMTEGREYKFGRAYFKTSHLSVYAVTSESRGDIGGGGCDAGLGFVPLIGLGALALRKREKRH